MTTRPTATREEIRRVLVITLILNVSVAAGKIIVGTVTGALAIVADGFHSLTDAAGNIAGLIANHYAARPADDNHPYGHRRFETLAALIIGALLLVTAWEIAMGALERIRDGAVPELTPLAFVVLGVTLIVNLFVSQYEMRAGQRLQSEFLLADARNTRADVFVTVSVIISSGIVVLTGWGWVDTVAALVVIGLIVRAAWQIFRQTGGVLVDTAPYSPEELSALASEVPSVDHVIRARSRGPANAAHIDIDVRVAPQMTADQAGSIRDAIQRHFHERLEGVAEVEVHFAPDTPDQRSPALTARAAADALGLGTHNVNINQDGDQTILELHVEVPSDETLQQAHERVSQLEADICQNWPEIDRVITHIEPEPTATAALDDSTAIKTAAAIESEAVLLLHRHYPDVRWHDLSVHTSQNGFAILLHAALPATMTVSAAHTIAEDAETLLRAELPLINRVTIHTEPLEAADHSPDELRSDV